VKENQILFSQLEKITGGLVIHFFEDQSIGSFQTDSRRMSIVTGVIFVAIKGEVHDGHQYIQQLYDQGVRQFIVEQGAEEDYASLVEANILKVENSVNALQKIVAVHRSAFNIPVIGITGSNGKTIVKEWLSQMLSQQYQVAKSPKSYNSQLGVALSVWELSANHELGVFEAGISKSDEMARLEKIIQPSIGIFTNIGSAHDRGFSSIDEKIAEKIKLFSNSKVIVYCKNHENISAVLQENLHANQQLFSWSFDEGGDVVIKSITYKSKYANIEIAYEGEVLFFKIPFTDKASVENIMTCIATCLYLRVSENDIQQGIDDLPTVAMRLEFKQGINQCYVIDDTYNNDLAGLKIALDFLSQQNQREDKTLILSDFAETEQDKKQFYAKVFELIGSKGIHKFIGIGTAIKKYHQDIGIPTIFYNDTVDFLEKFEESNFHNEIILVKGARKFTLEKVVKKLQQKVHGTVMAINLDSLTLNLNYFRGKLKPETKILVMIKAFAYGSGFLEIANLLQFNKVDYLGVAYPDEGIILRKNGIKLPILVMNAAPESFDKLIEHQLEPEIYSLSMIREFADFLKTNNAKSKVHIKLDTGMHRLGIEPKDLTELIAILKVNPQIEIASVFSHLVGSEGVQFDDFTKEQVEILQTGVASMEKELDICIVKHILKSSGIIRFPDYHFEMVRLGIGLHGIGYDEALQENLLPVASLKTRISQIKDIKKGETIGYDRRGEVNQDSRIATIAIGYADGFDRRFSNGVGEVLINGKFAPVIGNVCMDMTMINVTDIQAEEGDEVIIFGKDLPLKTIASKINSIPYEILTKVSERVKRVFYME